MLLFILSRICAPFALFRPLVLHYPLNSIAWEMLNAFDSQSSQYMFGTEFLVAPTMKPGCVNATVFVPTFGPEDEGVSWIHLVSTPPLERRHIYIFMFV